MLGLQLVLWYMFVVSARGSGRAGVPVTEGFITFFEGLRLVRLVLSLDGVVVLFFCHFWTFVSVGRFRSQAESAAL